MHLWIPTGALWWAALYGGFSTLLPLLLRWTEKSRNGLDVSPRTLLQRGELGLFGLLLAISGILDLRRSSLLTQFIAADALMLAIAGLMAASAWLENYSRVAEGLGGQDQRTWVDSRRLLFLVFSIAFTTEVLLEHSHEVWR